MKKTLFILAVLTLILAPMAPALAQLQDPSVLPINEGQAAQDFTSLEGILSWLQTIVNWIFVFVLVVAVIMFIYAGFIFITQGSDEGAQSKAKTMILYAIIGVIVILLAQAFIWFAASIVGVDISTPFGQTGAGS